MNALLHLPKLENFDVHPLYYQIPLELVDPNLTNALSCHILRNSGLALVRPCLGLVLRSSVWILALPYILLLSIQTLSALTAPP